MSVMVTSFQDCEVGEWGDEIARYQSESDTVVIYPKGIGVGPSITMSSADWRRISQQVEAALTKAGVK